MLLHDGKQLVPQVSDQPQRGGGDGHASPANLSGIDLRDDDPAGHAIAKRMAGDEAHHKNENSPAAAVNLIEPTNQRKRDKLQSAVGRNSRFASDTIHQP